MAGGPFQIRSKKWDIGILIGSLALLLVGFGGLFALQTIDSAGNPTLFFIVFLGILTFAGFAGPGIVYVLRKRNAWVKGKLPGGTMAWVRSHLYLPVLALVAAYVHASIVPFRAHLSSGKVLDARREHIGKPHRLKIYPPIGHTVDDGHDFLHLGVNIWEPDVFAFLDENMRK